MYSCTPQSTVVYLRVDSNSAVLSNPKLLSLLTERLKEQGLDLIIVDSDQDLREIERLKIHCAKVHFNEISDKEVTFDRVSSYDKLLEIIELR